MTYRLLARFCCAGALALALAACAPDTEPEATPTPSPTLAPTPEPTPSPTAQPTPKPAPRPAAARPAPVTPAQRVICYDCGIVNSITEVAQQGEGSGAGAVAGAVAGGVAGHQFGKGRGKDAATAAGAILGAIAGHQIEKRVRTTKSYDVAIAMEDGTQRVINVGDPAGLTIGARVRVEGNNIYLR